MIELSKIEKWAEDCPYPAIINVECVSRLKHLLTIPHLHELYGEDVIVITSIDVLKEFNEKTNK